MNTLLIPGYDHVKGEGFFLPPGGGIEFGELSVDAMRREVLAELEAPVLLGVFEGVVTYNGWDEHEIVFIYSARFADPSLYERARFDRLESNGVESVAEWIGIESRGTMGDREVDSQGAELVVLARENGTWRIKAIHWSSRHRRGGHPQPKARRYRCPPPQDPLA